MIREFKAQYDKVKRRAKKSGQIGLQETVMKTKTYLMKSEKKIVERHVL